MQKLDFVQKIEIISAELQSPMIMMKFNEAMSNQGQIHDFSPINELLFTSKARFDDLSRDEGFMGILKSLGADSIYSSKYLSELSRVMIHGRQISQLFLHPQCLRFLTFHNSLILITKATEILKDNVLSGSYDEQLNNGIIIFQISIKEYGLKPAIYIKILELLQELIDTLDRVFKQENNETKIILLDSGSDSNIGFQTGIQTAQSLFQIFKEAWDFIVNRRYYDNSQQNKAFLEELTCLNAIRENVKSGVLTEEDGLRYSHVFKSRIDALLKLGVLPKQIANENRYVENKVLLSDFQNSRLLTKGQDLVDDE